MHLLSRGPDTNPGRLERWLGSGNVEHLSRQMERFYWPVPLAGVPGAVFAMPGGGFSGEIRAGEEVCAIERARDSLRRYERAQRARLAQQRSIVMGRHHRDGMGHAAFSSLSALIAAQTGGKGQRLAFQKVGQTAIAVGNCIDLWTVGNQPAAGGAGAAAPGGTAPTNATTGALSWANPANSNTGHFVGGAVTAGTGAVGGNTLLLCDRLFMVAKTMNSTGTEAVTGTFSRYQSSTQTAENYAGGNFCYPMVVGTTLPNTAHNWTVCQYTDEGGNTAQSFSSVAGLASATSSIRHIDLAVGNWFLPLASGDVGVKALTQMQCSALVATGLVDFVVAHPIAFFPCPVANTVSIIDGINTAFNLARIYDNACLYFIEMPKPATTATTYSGVITAVAE